jgi:hypothetical protein
MFTAKVQYPSSPYIGEVVIPTPQPGWSARDLSAYMTQQGVVTLRMNDSSDVTFNLRLAIYWQVWEDNG